MRLLNRLVSAVNFILCIWPSAMGGHYLRYFLWKKSFSYCGERVRFDDRLVITGFPVIRIGEGASIISGSYLYAHDSSNLNVLNGPNVVLRAADHVFAGTEVPIRCQGYHPGRVVIGDDVWLAANVVVTSGVTIDNGCVVGAGSVVHAICRL